VIAASFASSEIVPKLQVALPNLRFGTYVAVGSWPASMPHGSDFVTGPCGFHVGFLTYHDTFSAKAPWNVERMASGFPVPGREAIGISDPEHANETEWNWDAYRSLPEDIHAPRKYALEFVGQLDNRSGYSDRWKFMHSRGRMNLSRWYVMSPSNVNVSNSPSAECCPTRSWPSCRGTWAPSAGARGTTTRRRSRSARTRSFR